MKNKAFSTVFLCLALLAGGSAVAEDWSKLPEVKRTKLGLYMTPAQAYEHVQQRGDKALFLDVRSRAEVGFLGMPSVADANVPYMDLSEWHAWDEKRSTFKLDVNSDFAAEVANRLKAKGLSKKDTIILLCRSGDRSSKAADLLADLGYTRVYSVTEGYEGDVAKDGSFKGQRAVNGWKNAKLPWTYKLDKDRMFKVGG